MKSTNQTEVLKMGAGGRFQTVDGTAAWNLRKPLAAMMWP